MTEPSEPDATVDDMATCIHCGVSDRDEPLIAMPVRVDGEDRTRPVMVCPAHVFTPWPTPGVSTSGHVDAGE